MCVCTFWFVYCDDFFPRVAAKVWINFSVEKFTLMFLRAICSHQKSHMWFVNHRLPTLVLAFSTNSHINVIYVCFSGLLYFLFHDLLVALFIIISSDISSSIFVTALLCLLSEQNETVTLTHFSLSFLNAKPPKPALQLRCCPKLVTFISPAFSNSIIIFTLFVNHTRSHLSSLSLSDSA